MPLVSFKNLGSQGLLTDLAPNELPLEAWTSAQNVRFTPLGVNKVGGDTQIYDTPSVEPLSLVSVNQSGNSSWVYGSTQKVYAIDSSGTANNITRQSVGVDVNYSATAADKWSMSNFTGLGILNNGVDKPQVWIPTSFATKCTDLPNWPANLLCNVLRPFKNYLVALDLTDTGTRKPTAIRWSHPADPASVPVSWDIADETKDAGEWYFNETQGTCTDLVQLRDEAIVYKNDAMYGMSFIGGLYIFKFRKISSITGIPYKNAAIEFMPGQHVIWTGDDIAVTDGQTIKSIITSKNRHILKRINASNYKSIFLTNNVANNEVWFCYTETPNATRASKALIWNWITGAWGERDLDGLNALQFGVVIPMPTGIYAETWDSDTGTWDADTVSWEDSQTSISRARLLGANATKLLYTNVGDQIAGSNYTAFVERHSFGIPFDQDLPPDISSWKFCREIWPRVSGDRGTILSVSIGSQTEIGGDVAWETAQVFTVGVDTKLNCTVSGRMFAIRFESTGAGSWTLNGFDLEVDYSGGY